MRDAEHDAAQGDDGRYLVEQVGGQQPAGEGDRDESRPHGHQEPVTAPAWCAGLEQGPAHHEGAAHQLGRLVRATRSLVTAAPATATDLAAGSTEWSSS
jgi:hypothetical protein